MTDDAATPVQDDLLKAIQKTLKLINRDNDAKDRVHKETAETLKSVQACLVKIDKSMVVMETERKAFIEAHKDRTLNCDKIHTDFEQRLRENPAPIRCKTNEDRLKKVEIKVEAFQPFMYKVIGAVIAIAILVPPVISAAFAFIVKHMTIKGG